MYRSLDPLAGQPRLFCVASMMERSDPTALRCAQPCRIQAQRRWKRRSTTPYAGLRSRRAVNPPKVAEARCYGSDPIDRVNHYVDPPREGEPDVNPATEELRKGSRGVQAAAPALVAALT